MKTAGGLGKKGLTLVELIVAMAIIAIVMGGTYTIMTTGIKTYNMNLEDTVGQQSLRTAMIEVSRIVRNPANTAAVTGTNTLTVNGKNFTVSGNALQYNGMTCAANIASISAGYADADHKVIQVDLVSADGTSLSTKISLE